MAEVKEFEGNGLSIMILADGTGRSTNYDNWNDACKRAKNLAKKGLICTKLKRYVASGKVHYSISFQVKDVRNGWYYGVTHTPGYKGLTINKYQVRQWCKGVEEIRNATAEDARLANSLGIEIKGVA